MRVNVFCRSGLFLLLLLTGAAAGQHRKISLREKYQVGDQYQVTTSTDLTGLLNTPGDPAKKTLPRTARKTGTARSSYDERVLAVNDNQSPTKTIRSYQTLQAQQKLGDDTTSAQLRGTIRSVVLQRDG